MRLKLHIDDKEELYQDLMSSRSHEHERKRDVMKLVPDFLEVMKYTLWKRRMQIHQGIIVAVEECEKRQEEDDGDEDKEQI